MSGCKDNDHEEVVVDFNHERVSAGDRVLEILGQKPKAVQYMACCKLCGRKFWLQVAPNPEGARYHAESNGGDPVYRTRRRRTE